MVEDSLINYNYAQPDFYRFNEDSIILAKLVISRYKNNDRDKNINAIDLCSGCGVIGIEVQLQCPNVSFSFNEKQSVFAKYIAENCKNIIHSRPKILINNLFDIDLSHYDLITINPPYFVEGTKRLSPNLERRTCRFHSRSFLSRLQSKIISEITGEVFMVYPTLVEGFTELEVIGDRVFQAYKRA